MGVADSPRLLRSWVALAASLALGACAALAPHFERPQLSVVGIELEGAQLLSQRFRVRVRVLNPNDRALPIQSIRFGIELDGERLGDGGTAAPFTVPARGEGAFEAIVTTDLATALGRILPRVRDGAPVDYRIVGTVNSDLPFLGPVAFDQRGSFTLK